MYTIVMMKHKDRYTLSKVSVVSYETLSEVMIFLADNFGGMSEEFHFYRDKAEESHFYICMKPDHHISNEFDMVQVFGNEYGVIRPVN